MKNIGVIGTGYVGLVHALVLAEYGRNVIAMDIDKEKIIQLQQGNVPIYEPKLEELLERNLNENRIHFTIDIEEIVTKCDVIFIAVGTPPAEDGSADLKYVKSVILKAAPYINRDIIIVNKSTVPVGTGRMIKQLLLDYLRKNQRNYSISIVSNPEFLREGKAVSDTLHPDRIVIGTEDDHTAEVMKEVYEPFIRNGVPILVTSIETAELIKYASNAFLAVKISFINEIAGLAEKVGADINEITAGMGMDQRIAPSFLEAGAGYGGSCFPKDTKAIVSIGRQYQEDMLVVSSAIQANENQKKKMVHKIEGELKGENGLEDVVIAVWGLSFKPGTDDMRDAPSIEIIKGLVEKGATIQAYCPKGMKEATWRLKQEQENITYCKDEYEAVENADALVIITEWKQFKEIDMSVVIRKMRGNYLFDLRNMFYNSPEIIHLFNYHGVGCNHHRTENVQEDRYDYNNKKNARDLFI